MNKVDPNINQRAAANPKDSVWVAASAGTGKTKVLSDRVLNLLLLGCPPEKILCLTFTKAAAAQMENRIALRLARWVSESDEELKDEIFKLTAERPSDKTVARARRLFAGVLEAKGGMKILTIHSFCQSLLKRFPLEAGVSPNFEVMDESDAEELMDRSIAAAIHDKELRDDLKIISLYVDESDLIADLKIMDKDRAKFDDALKKYGTIDGVIGALYQHYEVAPSESEEQVIAEICKLPSCVKSILDILLARGGVKASEAAEGLAAFLSLTNDEKLKNYKQYELVFLGKTTGRIKPEKVYEEDPAKSEAERVFALEEKRKTVVALAAVAAFLRVADKVLLQYKKRKITKGLLDYSDLILKAKELLFKSGAAAWVLYKLDGGIEHILVDEAQDTSAEQWDIVRALSDEFFAGEGASPFERTIFAVGDKKQSIYSFQGANPAKFALNKSYFEGQLERVGKTLKTVPLSVSFRSTNAVLSLVNNLLSNSEVKVGVLDENEGGEHIAFRDEAGGRVELWPSMKAEEDDTSEPWLPPIDRVKTKSAQDRLAAKIADKILAMIKGDILESEGRKIEPQDIMVLLRKRGSFFEKLVRELKTRNVPVTGIDRMKIKEQIAVMDLIALGDFLLLPEDDLNLAGLLRSPLFGFDEDEIYDVCFGRGDATVWDRLRTKAEGKNGKEKYKKTVATLTELLNMADAVLPSRLFGYVLGALNGRRKIIKRLGLDADDALAEFMNLVLDFETNNTPSLQGFLAWLKLRDVAAKRDLEQGDVKAVRITTVHSSKGLEAPIIFLPDTKAPEGGNKNRLYWCENEKGEFPLWFVSVKKLPFIMQDERNAVKAEAKKESKRLLYVAVTRPRDRLYITAWDRKNAKEDGGDDKSKKEKTSDTWYDLISESFDKTQSFEDKDGKVFFVSSPQKTMVKNADVRKEKVGAKLPLWVSEKAKDEPLPLKPLAPSKIGVEDDAVAPSPFVTARSGAIQKGKIVHKLLQFLPELPPDKREQIMRKYLELNAGEWDEAEREKVAKEVMAVLTDERLKIFFGEGSKAEVPLMGMLGNEAFSGQVDRLWVGEKEVVIIDYKTNQNVPSTLKEVPELYKKQLSVYKELLAKLFTKKSVKAYILWTQNLSLTEI